MKMPTRRSLWAVILFTLILSMFAIGCTQDAEGPDDSVLLQDPKYIMGSGLYKRHCAGCHGESGEGHTSLGPQINTLAWQEGITDEEITQIILEGRTVAGTSMDSFRELLTDDEIAAVIVYVRTLRE